MTGTSRNGTSYQLHGPDNASVIIAIHGLGLNRATFDGMVPPLSENHRVLTYDLYGHGESVPPPSIPTLRLFSEQLFGLMDELRIEKACLMGFSLGGMINRRFAIDHSERLSGLIILNSPHERGEELQAKVEAQARDSSSGGPAATIDAALERWFTPEFKQLHPEVVGIVRKGVVANDLHAYAQCRWVLANGVMELIRPVPPITHPALVLTCENDTGSTPDMARAIAGEIQGAKCLVIPKLKHMGLMEKPELFTAPILEFLNRLE